MSSCRCKNIVLTNEILFGSPDGTIFELSSRGNLFQLNCLDAVRVIY